MDNDTATGTGPQDPALTATQEGGELGLGIARADTGYLFIYNTPSTFSYILLILLGPSVRGLSGEDVRWMTPEHSRGVPHEGILIGKCVGSA